MRNPGWRRWLAGGLMAFGGIGTLGDLGAPDDPLAAVENMLGNTNLFMLEGVRGIPLYTRAVSESRWRGTVRKSHRIRENARTLAVSAGALLLAWGILSARRWAAPFLAAGLVLWTSLYALDLWEGLRILGAVPKLYALGQGANLLFLTGLLVWLIQDDRRGQAPVRVVPSIPGNPEGHHDGLQP